MLFCPVFAKLHSRRSPNFFPRLPPIPSPLACCSSVSLFPRHAALTSLHPYFLTSSFLSPLDATLMHHPASVANKRLTVWLSLLDATFTKNRGGTSFKPKAFTSLPPYFITSLLPYFSCRPAGTRMASLMSVLAFLHDSRSP